MSDPDCKQLPLAGWGEPAPSKQDGEVPLGVAVEVEVGSGAGIVRARGAESERTVKLEAEQLEQLAAQLALRLAEPKARWTFGELAAKWLQHVKRVRLQDEQRAIVQLRPLWERKESDLTSARIEEWFQQLSEMSYSACAINKYRSAGRLVIAYAQGEGQWGAANPFKSVKRLKERRREYELLTLDEVRRVLPHLSDDYRRMFRISVVLGLRTGELFALRKEDINFTQGLIYVRRSHARNTTKTNTSRTLPLLGCIAGDILDATRASSSGLLFPGADGGLRREDSKMAKILRTAMGRAGVVKTYKFTCRHPGCEWVMEFAPPITQEMRCPTHDWKAWQTPVVKRTRWYDARHMASTFHREAGADRLAVKLLLGHGGDITDDVYTHMGADWVRRELSRFVL